MGAVFDFLDIHVLGYHWPAFNLADSFICIGAVLVIGNGLFFNKEWNDDEDKSDKAKMTSSAKRVDEVKK